MDQSPSQWAGYENVLKSDFYHLQFCSHRWAENKTVWERAIDACENIVKAVKFQMRLLKSKKLKEDNKNYQSLKSAINDPLIPVK